MMDEKELELEIEKKGLTAPRVTSERINDQITHKLFWNPPGTTLTVCCLVLRNGFTVSGESACVDPDNFDPVIGENIAYHNAREKIWPLEGYLLREHLHSFGNSKQETPNV